MRGPWGGPSGGLASWAQGQFRDTAAEGHPPFFSGLGQSCPRQFCRKASAKADCFLLGTALSCSLTLWPQPELLLHCSCTHTCSQALLIHTWTLTCGPISWLALGCASPQRSFLVIIGQCGTPATTARLHLPCLGTVGLGPYQQGPCPAVCLSHSAPGSPSLVELWAFTVSLQSVHVSTPEDCH